VSARIARRPVNRCQRSTITSAYGRSISIMKHFRPVCSHPISVLPLPPNRSRTFSPGRDEYSMARTASSTGFWVMCSICWGLIFFTDHTSGTLLGPKNWWAAPSLQP